jgi:hypothetical protein
VTFIVICALPDGILFTYANGTLDKGVKLAV